MKTIINYCTEMNENLIGAIIKYAKRLEAEELIIHEDYTITLTCEDGYICIKYSPSLKELFK